MPEVRAVFAGTVDGFSIGDCLSKAGLEGHVYTAGPDSCAESGIEYITLDVRKAEN